MLGIIALGFVIYLIYTWRKKTKIRRLRKQERKLQKKLSKIDYDSFRYGPVEYELKDIRHQIYLEELKGNGSLEEESKSKSSSKKEKIKKGIVIFFVLGLLGGLLELFGISKSNPKSTETSTTTAVDSTNSIAESSNSTTVTSAQTSIETTISTVTEKTIDNSIEKYNTLIFNNYYAINGVADFEKEIPEAGKISTGRHDSKGRPSYVIAHLNYDIVSKAKGNKRHRIDEEPPGWQKNEKVTINDPSGKKYNGYFYNRSHLLATSLGGSETTDNFITGTRTQNVGINNHGGMAYTEEKVRNYFKNPTENTVIYEAIPIYKDDEKVARFVKVNVKSSDGVINEQVIVSNTAYGWEINYMTGDYKEK